MRIRARIPDELQFRATDTPNARSQKLEIFRRWVSNSIELLSAPDESDPLGTAAYLDFTTDFTVLNNLLLPTTLAVSNYVATQIAGIVAGFTLQGTIDCSANPNYPAASEGYVYIVSAAGKIGGAAGVNVDIGDTIIAMADNAGGTQAGVGASWFILEHNLVGALLSANNLSDVADAATARANLLAAPIYLPVTVQAAAYQFVLADAFSHVRFTSAGAVAATVPKNATVAFPIGTRIRGTQAGAGQITLTPEDVTVTLNSADGALLSRAQFSVWEIEKVDTDEWDVLGDVST